MLTEEGRDTILPFVVLFLSLKFIVYTMNAPKTDQELWEEIAPKAKALADSRDMDGLAELAAGMPEDFRFNARIYDMISRISDGEEVIYFAS
jgi:hypothetical protein